MSERPSIVGLLSPIIAPYPPDQQRIFVALGERVAAGRYRAWSEAVDDEEMRAVLLACASREEDIATRVESLASNAADVQEQISKEHPDLESKYRGVFEGLSLSEQFAIQADGERAGAAAWRGFAEASSDPEEAAVLEACAPMEEANAGDLERLIAILNRT